MQKLEDYKKEYKRSGKREVSYYNKTAKTKNVIYPRLTWRLEVAHNQCTHTTHYYSLVFF